MHRFTWDVHYQPLPSTGSGQAAPPMIGGPNLPIAAIGRNTIAAPTTPWVNPGQFTVKLTVNGKTYSQPIVVKPDPRVKTPALAMQQVYSLSKTLYYGAIDVQAAARGARAIRDQIAARRPQASGPAAAALTSLDRTIEALVGTPAAGGDTLSAAGGGLAGVMNSLQGADVRPTTVQLTSGTARSEACPIIVAPLMRAPLARDCVRSVGFALPSPGIHTAPARSSVRRIGTRLPASDGESARLSVSTTATARVTSTRAASTNTPTLPRPEKCAPASQAPVRSSAMSVMVMRP
jgi:hypothetical protein